MFEYACHENNYALGGILRGARVRDLEVDCTNSKGGMVAEVVRIGHLGRRDPRRVRPHAGDVVAAEHWCSNGFANTDLDMQLKKHGIHKLIVIGLIAHTCVEATVRYAAELGFFGSRW